MYRGFCVGVCGHLWTLEVQGFLHVGLYARLHVPKLLLQYGVVVKGLGMRV